MGNSLGKIFYRLFFSVGCGCDSRILMVGLDNAGKTTILYRLKLGDVVTTIPTIGFNVETVEYKSLRLTVWDVGGQERIRALWRHYFPNTSGIIFVVDASDFTRVEEAKDELWKMLGEPELSRAHLLVFANKQDLPNAIPIGKLTDMLGLHNINDRKWFVQNSCAVQGTGLYEGLDWFVSALTAKK